MQLYLQIFDMTIKLKERKHFIHFIPLEQIQIYMFLGQVLSKDDIHWLCLINKDKFTLNHHFFRLSKLVLVNITIFFIKNYPSYLAFGHYFHRSRPYNCIQNKWFAQSRHVLLFWELAQNPLSQQMQFLHLHNILRINQRLIIIRKFATFNPYLKEYLEI